MGPRRMENSETDYRIAKHCKINVNLNSAWILSGITGCKKAGSPNSKGILALYNPGVFPWQLNYSPT